MNREPPRKQGKVSRIRGDDSGAITACGQRDQRVVLKLSPFVAIPVLGIANPLNKFSRFPPVGHCRFPPYWSESEQGRDQPLCLACARPTS